MKLSLPKRWAALSKFQKVGVVVGGLFLIGLVGRIFESGGTQAPSRQAPSRQAPSHQVDLLSPVPAMQIEFYKKVFEFIKAELDASTGLAKSTISEKRREWLREFSKSHNGMRGWIGRVTKIEPRGDFVEVRLVVALDPRIQILGDVRFYAYVQEGGRNYKKIYELLTVLELYQSVKFSGTWSHFEDVGIDLLLPMYKIRLESIEIR